MTAEDRRHCCVARRVRNGEGGVKRGNSSLERKREGKIDQESGHLQRQSSKCVHCRRCRRYSPRLRVHCDLMSERRSEGGILGGKAELMGEDRGGEREKENSDGFHHLDQRYAWICDTIGGSSRADIGKTMHDAVSSQCLGAIPLQIARAEPGRRAGTARVKKGRAVPASQSQNCPHKTRRRFRRLAHYF